MTTRKSQCDVADLQRASNSGGFSLIEVLFATTILIAGVVSLAQLFAVAAVANTVSKSTTFASILAQQKMEQLRGLTWSFDSLGLPLTDTTTNTTTVPEAVTGGLGLTPSPSGALTTNTDGYVDYLDERGNLLGGGAAVLAGTAFIRRWSIQPLPRDPNYTLLLQVIVTRPRNRAADGAPIRRRLPGEARIVSLKTRKAP